MIFMPIIRLLFFLFYFKKTLNLHYEQNGDAIGNGYTPMRKLWRILV